VINEPANNFASGGQARFLVTSGGNHRCQEGSGAPERSACIYGLAPSNFHGTRNQIDVRRVHLNSIGDDVYEGGFFRKPHSPQAIQSGISTRF
jgi:hypothetical protein